MDRILRGIWVLKLAEFYELGLRGWNLSRNLHRWNLRTLYRYCAA